MRTADVLASLGRFAGGALLALAAVLPGPSLAEGGTAEVQRWPVHQAGRMGYMDRAGKLVIPARYDEASAFHDGLAAVLIGQSAGPGGALSGGRYGFIDPQGALVVPAEYSFVQPFSDGRAAVKQGRKRMYIDRTGKPVITGDFARIQPFHEGLACVEYSSGRGAFLKPDGAVAFHLPPGADIKDPPDFSEGHVVVRFRRSQDDEGSWVLDRQGKQVLEIPHRIARGVRGGLLAVRDAASARWGFMDLTGQWVVPPRYPFAWGFEDGRAVVNLEGDRWGHIDRTGKVLQVFEQRPRGPFREGLATVIADGKLGYMDLTGAQVIPFGRWQDPMNSLSSFTGGLALVRETVQGELREGYIDRTGAVIWAPTPVAWQAGDRP